MEDGRCYERAGRWMLGAHYRDGDLLVHGWGELLPGLKTLNKNGHAWIERTDGTVVDPSKNLRKPLIASRLDYYQTHGIDDSESQKYTFAEAAKRLSRTEHYGPWVDRIPQWDGSVASVTWVEDLSNAKDERANRRKGSRRGS